MNREIKFRGKRKDNGEWVYGGYYYSCERYALIINWESVIRDEESGYPPIYDVVEVDPATVGQFTGRKDTKEAEMFKKDIIRAYNPIRLEKGEKADYIGIISWSENSLAWILVDGNGEFIEMLCRVEQPEIIGTISDNPELMKTAGAEKG